MGHQLQWDFIGLENFRRILTEPRAFQVFRNTLIYTFFTLGLFNVSFGLILALTTSYLDRYGHEKRGLFFRTLWLLPRFSPPIVYGVIWLWILDPTDYGLLNGLLEFISAGGAEPVNWINSFPMIVIIVTNGIIGASFGMLLFYSAIQSIPHEHFWASLADGANWFQQVRYIILPQIKWPFLFVTAYQTLSLLTSYEHILVITGGGPFYQSMVWALYGYLEAFGGYFAQFEFGFAAAVTMILVIISIIASIIFLRIFRFDEMMDDPKIEVD